MKRVSCEPKIVMGNLQMALSTPNMVSMGCTLREQLGNTHGLYLMMGMIELYGSKEAFTKKLDDTFSFQITGENASVDITGSIGQYAHGNEPSHHVAYLYNYAGEAWKTQEKVRQMMTQLYTSGVYGLVGNDDCGQMSAWYVFSALGFYPVNPADGNYVIGVRL